MTEIFEECPAASTVDHDELSPTLEGRDIDRRQTAGLGSVARVVVEGAATGLPGHLDHLVAVRLERSPGRVVNVAEEPFHRAATKQGDSGAGAGRRAGRRQGGRAGGGWGWGWIRRVEHREQEAQGTFSRKGGAQAGGAKPFYYRY